MKTMNRNDFLEKICNFIDSPEWQYLGELPCIIDFYDDGCAPCRAIEPLMTSLAEKYKSRVEFYKVDIMAEKQLAQELGVNYMPTLVLCPVGDKPIVLQGVATEKDLTGRIETELLGN